MSPLLVIISFLALYALFLVWYGGKGKPLTPIEIERFMRELQPAAPDEQVQTLLAEVRLMVSNDDGEEFVMQNLVRHRAKAQYPPGYPFNDDPRAADQRYAKAILWPLLRHGNVPVFAARRSGRFIDPVGADQWHYVAMVRYRSRRDFLRFCVAIERTGGTVHKWAAIEKTHVFPVKPMLSLIFVRGAVAVFLTLIAVALCGIAS